MPSLSWRFNARNVELHPHTKGGSVDVLLRNGEYEGAHWLGFIDEESARKIPFARPVLLKVARYSDGDYPITPWVDMPFGHFVQGCLIDAGVYAVTRGQVKVKLVTK